MPKTKEITGFDKEIFSNPLFKDKLWHNNSSEAFNQQNRKEFEKFVSVKFLR